MSWDPQQEFSCLYGQYWAGVGGRSEVTQEREPTDPSPASPAALGIWELPFHGGKGNILPLFSLNVPTNGWFQSGINSSHQSCCTWDFMGVLKAFNPSLSKQG